MPREILKILKDTAKFYFCLVITLLTTGILLYLCYYITLTFWADIRPKSDIFLYQTNTFPDIEPWIVAAKITGGYALIASFFPVFFSQPPMSIKHFLSVTAAILITTQAPLLLAMSTKEIFSNTLFLTGCALLPWICAHIRTAPNTR